MVTMVTSVTPLAIRYSTPTGACMVRNVVIRLRYGFINILEEKKSSIHHRFVVFSQLDTLINLKKEKKEIKTKNSIGSKNQTM